MKRLIGDNQHFEIHPIKLPYINIPDRIVNNYRFLFGKTITLF